MEIGQELLRRLRARSPEQPDEMTASCHSKWVLCKGRCKLIRKSRVVVRTPAELCTGTVDTRLSESLDTSSARWVSAACTSWT